MNQLTAIKAFTKVVELNSFSAAARELKFSNAAVSKNVSDLEAHLGTQLLVRTTRRISVTQAGETYYQQCVRILQDLQEADLCASADASTPRGHLRVNAPMSFGLLKIAPLVAEFLKDYPEIEVDLVLNDYVVDMLAGGFDVGLRIGGALKDSTLVSKKLTAIDRVLCGTPDYFSERGHLSGPIDLLEHRCLVYSLSSSFGAWSFERDGRRETLQVTGPLMVNNSLAIKQALVAGVGISLIPTFIVEKELQEGRLIQTMQNYRADTQTLYALYPHAKHVSQKVRVFVDFMSDHFAS